ncbi:MAG: ribonuclease R [bacterium]|nr:ribonuclease R [bacterium]
MSENTQQQDSPTQESLLKLIRTRGRKGMNAGQLAAHVADTADVDKSRARRILRPILKDLVRDGVIVIGRGKRYFAAEHSNLVTGRLRVTLSGFGIVETEMATDAPIRISGKALRGALDGDQIQVRLERARRKARAEGWQEATVVRIVEARRREVVGRWIGEKRPEVRPFDRRLKLTIRPEIPSGGETPRNGEFVVVALDRESQRGDVYRGLVQERLGMEDEQDVVERVVLRSHGIDPAFPREVFSEVGHLAKAKKPFEEERVDLRDLPVITIDPATARDFDDAVSAQRGSGSAILAEVHIADVASWVKEGSLTDIAARQRGTSVYLPGLCVPMLPELLSGDLCSLKPEVDRLTMTVRFSVDEGGNVCKVDACSSVIRSKRRCTYEEVAGWLEQPRLEWPQETEPFADSLHLLIEAAQRLRQARMDRGGLDFDRDEPEIQIDDDGKVVDITARQRLPSHRLIEELMIAANRAVGRLLLEKSQPGIYRVHDTPDPLKIEGLRTVVKEFGHKLGGEGGSASAFDLQRLLNEVRGTEHERLISTMVLRSMARAHYNGAAGLHYALASDDYVHFTSPIRRYPDLVCHRALKRVLSRHGPENEPAATPLEGLAQQCSAAEQRAEAAERDAARWRTVQFLRERIGEVFRGHISGVTEFGCFVTLEPYLVDGLVHVSAIDDDYYLFEADRQRLVGERKGKIWRLGDPIRVRLVAATLDGIDLAVVGGKPSKRE